MNASCANTGGILERKHMFCFKMFLAAFSYSLLVLLDYDKFSRVHRCMDEHYC